MKILKSLDSEPQFEGVVHIVEELQNLYGPWEMSEVARKGVISVYMNDEYDNQGNHCFALYDISINEQVTKAALYLPFIYKGYRLKFE